MTVPSAAGLAQDALRFLRGFGVVAAAWSTVLAIAGPEPGRPLVLWIGLALVWAWALGSLRLRAVRPWFAGWLVAALVVQLLGFLAATGGWSVVGGAPFVPIGAAALDGRSRVIGGTVGLFSAAALVEGLWGGSRTFADALVTVLIFVVGGVALGWLVRTVRAGEAERDALRERIAQAEADRAVAVERAEAAARLHDSVLQSLVAVVRSHDVEEARRHARTASAELRRWLRGGDTDAASLRRLLEEAVSAEVRDRHLTVGGAGDRTVGEPERLLVAAAVEAVRNAVEHTDGPVRVYTEVTADATTVWVADHGSGFDPDDVPEDRLGVRGSIVARLERAGGDATVRSGPDGTEWTLRLPTTPV